MKSVARWWSREKTLKPHDQSQGCTSPAKAIGASQTKENSSREKLTSPDTARWRKRRCRDSVASLAFSRLAIRPSEYGRQRVYGRGRHRVYDLASHRPTRPETWRKPTTGLRRRLRLRRPK